MYKCISFYMKMRNIITEIRSNIKFYLKNKESYLSERNGEADPNSSFPAIYKSNTDFSNLYPPALTLISFPFFRIICCVCLPNCSIREIALMLTI